MRGGGHLHPPAGTEGPEARAAIMTLPLVQGLIYAPRGLRPHTHITTQAISVPWEPCSEMPQGQAGCQGDLADSCPDSLGSSTSQRASPHLGPCSEFSVLWPL